MNPNWVGKPKKNYPCIGDRQLEPDEEPEVECWSCKRELEREAILDCDGCCPCCGAEIISDDDPGESNEDPE